MPDGCAAPRCTSSSSSRRGPTRRRAYFIWQNGLRVYTTLDWDWSVCGVRRPQPHRLDAVKATPSPARTTWRRSRLCRRRSRRSLTTRSLTSVVAIRPTTGEVLVMVGSLDYFDDAIDGQVNVALAERQPGSSFKPYTYLTAFESGNFAAGVDGDGRAHGLPDGNPPMRRTTTGAIMGRSRCARRSSGRTTSRPSG